MNNITLREARLKNGSEININNITMKEARSKNYTETS